MAVQRPASVTVMGILNIVFGSLGLLCYVCVGVMFLALMGSTAGFPGGVNPIQDMMNFMERQIPGYKAIMISSLILGFLLSVLLLVSGIGLLNMQGWARVLSILYSIIMILVQIGSLI